MINKIKIIKKIITSNMLTSAHDNMKDMKKKTKMINKINITNMPTYRHDNMQNMQQKQNS
jgi:hypothetical protein